MLANALFLLNLISTWYMVGLIWMVQIVHYKMFDRVGEDVFVRYAVDHGRLITPIVMVPMLIELITSVGLLASLAARCVSRCTGGWIGVGGRDLVEHGVASGALSRAIGQWV